MPAGNRLPHPKLIDGVGTSVNVGQQTTERQ
jgi:hypothetical protein